MKKLLTSQYLVAYLIALIIFYFSYGFNVLNPENVNWLMSARHDWGLHYLGWAFFREDPWMFPIGGMNSYMYPIGTNVGFTDSIPIIAIPFKLIEDILPAEFQYFGIWILFCYLMISHYTVKIAGIYNIKPVYTLLTVLLVVSNPVLWYRGMHPALCAHGFLLASLYFYLLPADQKNADNINRKQVVFTLITALIHPYLYAMMIGFNFILPLKHYFYGGYITLTKAILYPVVTLVATLLLWYVVGLIGFDNQAYSAEKAFEFPFNLNSLYNSWNVSSFFPGLSRGDEANYESLMYLGLGMFILMAITLVLLFMPQGNAKQIVSKKQLIPLLAFTIASAIFAISNKAMLGDTVVYEFPIPEFVARIGSIFRSSARFFWIIYYMLILFFCIVFVKSKINPKIKVSLLALVVIVQIYDTKHLFTSRKYPSGTFDTPLDDQSWVQTISGFENVITVWPFYMHLLTYNDFQDLAYLAHKVHKPITTGAPARKNELLVRAYTDSLINNINNNTLKSSDLYVSTPQNLSQFGILLANNIVRADYLDGYYLVHDPNRKVIINNPTPQSIAKTDSVMQKYGATAKMRQIVPLAGKKIRNNIESFAIVNNVIMASGWAFAEERENHTGDSLFIAITRDNKTYAAPAEATERPDVAAGNATLNKCGFFAIIKSKDEILPTDKIGLAIKTREGEWLLAETDKHKIADPYKNTQKIDHIPQANPKQKGNIDGFTATDKEISISGWSIIDEAPGDGNVIKVLFKGAAGNYTANTDIIFRPDVKGSNKQYDYEKCGFSVKVLKTKLPKGKYTVAILLANNKTKAASIMDFDKNFEIN